MPHVYTIILILVLTVLSGLGDAQGFIHGSKVWLNGHIVWTELLKSALGFGFGISMYWIVIRYLQGFGITSPEIQTIGWFAVTILGVAIAGGQFFLWKPIDQLVAVGIITGIGWLLFRTSV